MYIHTYNNLILNTYTHTSIQLVIQLTWLPVSEICLRFALHSVQLVVD